MSEGILTAAGEPDEETKAAQAKAREALAALAANLGQAETPGLDDTDRVITDADIDQMARVETIVELLVEHAAKEQSLYSNPNEEARERIAAMVDAAHLIGGLASETLILELRLRTVLQAASGQLDAIIVRNYHENMEKANG